MRQIIFRIPVPFPGIFPDGIPIYGYGLMLFVAFVVCTWLAGRRAQREGIDKQHIQDLAIWLFVGGIVGSRVVFMIQYGVPIEQFFRIWEGGLVFYGALLGGVIAYLLAYRFVIRRHNLSGWKIADIVAPTIALGLCIGRVGCLLNGCCYGGVACAECPQVHFYLSSLPRFKLVEQGYQTAAGFIMSDTADDDRTVGAVEPGSPAAEAGLRTGDVIVRIDGRDVNSYADLVNYLVLIDPVRRGKNDLSLAVKRPGPDGQPQEIELPPFTPRTLGLHPTQVYESISTFLLFVFLSAYYPFRRHDGEVMVLFLLGYSVHRFLNEILRDDTEPVAFGLTLSENGSILVFAVAIVLGIWLWRKPAQYRPAAA